MRLTLKGTMDDTGYSGGKYAVGLSSISRCFCFCFRADSVSVPIAQRRVPLVIGPLIPILAEQAAHLVQWCLE